MIYVTVGTQRFNFNRLFDELERLISERVLVDEVIAQVGQSGYQTKLFKTFTLIPHNESLEYINKSDIIIAHAGTSTIIQALRKNKKIIVVPRLKEYGEHVDNHQLEIAEVFKKRNLVEVVYDIKYLSKTLIDVKNKNYSTYSFNNEDLLLDIKNNISLLLEK